MNYSKYLDYVTTAKINPDVFTADVLSDVITDGEYAGCSVAMLLASSKKGRTILVNIPELANKIHPNTLNQIIQDGPGAGMSVAYWLAATAKGRKILADNPELASKIHPDTLNHIIQVGEHAGESVAYWLATAPEGRKILEVEKFLLGKLISPETFTSIFTKIPTDSAWKLLTWPMSSIEGITIMFRNYSCMLEPARNAFIAKGLGAQFDEVKSVFLEALKSLIEKHKSPVQEQLTGSQATNFITPGFAGINSNSSVKETCYTELEEAICEENKEKVSDLVHQGNVYIL